MTMRSDMYKVIVERPRLGGLTTGTSRRYRNDSELGGKIGMRRGYARRKYLNENLAPLRRWLASQANRRWDKVYRELCAGIDRRNTVQEHIFTHIDQFVRRDTRWLDGKVYVQQFWPQMLVRVEESDVELYVHPVTEILCKNQGRLARRRRVALERERAKEQVAARRRDLDDLVQLHKLDGIWYRVILDRIPEPQISVNEGQVDAEYPRVWDIIHKTLVSRTSKESDFGPANPTYGTAWVYAKFKQQLSSAELRRYDLSNDNAGTTRRCHLWGAARPGGLRKPFRGHGGRPREAFSRPCPSHLPRTPGWFSLNLFRVRCVESGNWVYPAA
jgi:hypothetical protein